MTPAEVFKNADKTSDGARLAAWMICGGDEHPVNSLPRCYL